MASAQQLIGLIKSHAEGNEDRFFDLAMQLAATEEQKGHNRLAEQLRQWAEAGKTPPDRRVIKPIPLAAPRGGLADFLKASYPEERLQSVILPAETADTLKHIVQEIRMSARLEEKGLRPRHKILLAGSPGTGKTLSASALAGELHFPLFNVLLHGIITKYMGETAQKLAAVFEAIHTTRGVYLFDEIDALAAARSAENDIGEARRILNSFLQFLDEDCGPSLVIATTNLPEILDRAILRRFDLVLFYDVPDESAIKTAIKRRLSRFDTDKIDWKKVVECAKGLSTADIIAAAEDSARICVLSGAEDIPTANLLKSLKQRRNLQRLGEKLSAEKPAAFAHKKPKCSK